MLPENNVTVKPASGKIAIRPWDDPERSKGGLWLVHNPNEAKPVVGEVIAICEPYAVDGQPYDPLFKVGDIVVFGKYSGSEVKIGRTSVIILKEIDILCTLTWPQDGDSLSR